MLHARFGVIVARNSVAFQAAMASVTTTSGSAPGFGRARHATTASGSAISVPASVIYWQTTVRPHVLGPLAINVLGVGRHGPVRTAGTPVAALEQA